MEQKIEDWIIEGIKHPLHTLLIISIIVTTAFVLHIVTSKIKWSYKRQKFFKQLEMKLYNK